MDWEGSGRGLIGELNQDLSGETEENYNQLSQDCRCAPIRTNHLPNSSPQSFRYAKQLPCFVLLFLSIL
jgi:hypothetical protein